MAKLPEYLQSIRYQNPTDPDNLLFHYALGTRLNMFQWLKTQPEQLLVFSKYNAAAAKIEESNLLATMSALFPQQPLVSLREVPREAEDPVQLVDVGCGHGRALTQFRRLRPDIRGRMVAQDLPEVIAGREVDEGIENIAYNFLDPQPVKGGSLDLLQEACRFHRPHLLSSTHFP